jgi:hypothetical protein
MLIRMQGIEEQEAHSWREKELDLSLIFTIKFKLEATLPLRRIITSLVKIIVNSKENGKGLKSERWKEGEER